MEIDNFSFVVPGVLAGMARPGAGLIDLPRRGVGAIVCLTEEAPDMAMADRAGLRVLHLPIRDFQPPAREQIGDFLTFVAECRIEGRAVAVHCTAGMGRTGTMLACYFVAAEGLSAQEAIRHTRRLRPGSIETPGQEECVRSLAEERRTGGK